MAVELWKNFEPTYSCRRQEMCGKELDEQRSATSYLLNIISNRFNPTDYHEGFEESWSLRSSYFKLGAYYFRVDRSCQFFSESGRETGINLPQRYLLDVMFSNKKERRSIMTISTEILTARGIDDCEVFHLSRYSPRDLCLIGRALSEAKQINEEMYCIARDGKYFLD
jgi:hypothetical protein